MLLGRRLMAASLAWARVDDIDFHPLVDYCGLDDSRIARSSGYFEQSGGDWSDHHLGPLMLKQPMADPFWLWSGRCGSCAGTQRHGGGWLG